MSKDILFHELADMLPEVTEDHTTVLEILKAHDEVRLEADLESLEVANYCMSVFYGNVAMRGAEQGPLKNVAEERLAALQQLPIRTGYYQNNLGKLSGTFNVEEIVPLRSVLGDGYEDLYRRKNGAFKLNKSVNVTAAIDTEDPLELYQAAQVSHDYHKSRRMHYKPHVLRTSSLLGVRGVERRVGLFKQGRRYEFWDDARVQAINQQLGELLLEASDVEVQASVDAQSIHTLGFVGLNVFNMDTTERPQIGLLDLERRMQFRLLGALL